MQADAPMPDGSKIQMILEMVCSFSEKKEQKKTDVMMTTVAAATAIEPNEKPHNKNAFYSRDVLFNERAIDVVLFCCEVIIIIIMNVLYDTYICPALRRMFGYSAHELNFYTFRSN